jgi:hypothetical protein
MISRFADAEKPALIIAKPQNCGNSLFPCVLWGGGVIIELMIINITGVMKKNTLGDFFRRHNFM